jgi:hypothetical protein
MEKVLNDMTLEKRSEGTSLRDETRFGNLLPYLGEHCIPVKKE